MLIHFSYKHKNTRICRKRGIRGQVLILGVMALILITTGIFILFDLQRIIRGKSKTIAAIDSAALTGANWQRHSLNLIGELNLVKACTTLITDPAYGIGNDPANYMKVQKDKSGNITQSSIQRAEQEFAALEAASDNISQMQLRISFVGPLVGFGAAQQAAKNNGLSYDEDCIEFINEMRKYLTTAEYYIKDDYLKQEYFGYQWRMPYYNLLGAIREGGRGIAVGTNVYLVGLPRLYSDPPTVPDYLSYIQNRGYIEAILGRDWCVIRTLVDAAWTPQWWGNIKRDLTEQKIMNGSEILNLGLEFLPARKPDDEYGKKNYISQRNAANEILGEEGATRETIEDLANKRNMNLITNEYNAIHPVTDPNDEDLKFNPLPALSWSVFGDRWVPYSDLPFLESNFRAPFREGAAYTSGALSYFSVHIPVQSLTSRFDFSRHLYFGSRTEGARRMTHHVQEAGKGIRKSNNLAPISFDAVAKPFGRLSMRSGEKRPPFAARLVLPVFEKVTLVPVSLECPSGLPMYDFAWVLYITKYLPALGATNDLEAALAQLPANEAAQVNPFVEALRLLDSPEFREQGRTWLNAEATGHNEYDPVTGEFIRHVTDTLNRDHCNDWPKGGSGGPRRGLDPSS